MLDQSQLHSCLVRWTDRLIDVEIPNFVSLSRRVGINFTVYLQTVRLLWRSRRKNSKHAWFYLVYSTVIMALGLLYLIAITNFGQLENVDHRDYPGGVLAYEQTDFLNPLFFAGSVGFYVVDWFADALLVFAMLSLRVGFC